MRALAVIPTLLASLALAAAAAAQEGIREAAPEAPRKPPQLTKAPELLEFHPAEYPPAALERGEQADVACLVDIGSDGRVLNVVIEKGASPEFDAAALAAIRKFRFSPAELDGEPGAVRIRYVYHFVVERKRVEAAQENPDAGTLRGRVVEAGTRRAIPGAEILVQGTSFAATAGSDGTFELSGVPPGNYVATVSAPAFAEGRARMKLEPKGTAEATIYLRRTMLGELSATILGEKPREAPTRRTLSHEEFVNSAGSLNDPVRVIQNLPGLARAPLLGGALLVRGSAPDDTGTYLDGHKIPLLFHFLGGPSILNEQLLDRIDFYPGGYGAYYGRNVSGVVDVHTRPGDGQGFHGSASLDLVQAVGFVEGPVASRTRAAVAGRRSHIDLFLPLFLPNDPETGTTVVTPIYWDYQARVDHKLGGGGDLSLLLFGSDDSLEVVQRGGRLVQPLSLDSHTGFHRAIGTWQQRLREGLELRVSPSVGWAVQSFASEGGGGGPFSAPQGGSVTVVSFGGRAELRWQPLENVQLRGGADVLFDRYRVDATLQIARNLRSLGIPITEEVQITRRLPFSQFGQYVEAEIRAGKWQLTPGLRVDVLHWYRHTNTVIDPRLWVRRELTESTALKAYAGLYHQPPTPFQIDPEVGNPAVGTESAWHFGMGLEHRFNDVWNVSVEGFYNRRQDIIVRAFAEALPDGTIVNDRYANDGIGRSFGLEVLLKREITSKLYGWLSYTLSRAEILRRPGEEWRRFTFDQPHILTAVLGYRPSVGWEISSRLRLVSGNPTTPIVGATFDADSGDFIARRGELDSARLPTFRQLDVRGQYTWTAKLFQVSAYLDVQNVLNLSNEEFRLYDYRYREQGSLSGLPILPTLGAKVRW